MSDYTTDEYGNVIEAYQGQHPLVAAFQENPVQVIQQAAQLEAQQAAAGVGQAVFAKQNYEYQQATQAAAKEADAKLAAKVGLAWEHEKKALAEEWIAPRANILLDPWTVIDADAMATKLASGFCQWHNETAEEAEFLQRLSDTEFADDLIKVHKAGSYSSRMANADYQRALRDVQR